MSVSLTSSALLDVVAEPHSLASVHRLIADVAPVHRGVFDVDEEVASEIIRAVRFLAS